MSGRPQLGCERHRFLLSSTQEPQQWKSSGLGCDSGLTAVMFRFGDGFRIGPGGDARRLGATRRGGHCGAQRLVSRRPGRRRFLELVLAVSAMGFAMLPLAGAAMPWPVALRQDGDGVGGVGTDSALRAHASVATRTHYQPRMCPTAVHPFL